jgi:hypothetical protein
MTCQNCRQPAPTGANYCEYCGKPLASGGVSRTLQTALPAPILVNGGQAAPPVASPGPAAGVLGLIIWAIPRLLQLTLQLLAWTVQLTISMLNMLLRMFF